MVVDIKSCLVGKLIMFDGIDKGGKGTACAALRSWAESQGFKVFDLIGFQKQHGRLPEPSELDSYDGVISGEPTYCWSGLDLREEHVKDNGRNYEANETAELFSANRCTLYRRVLLPSLRKGLFWIQERGVVTSMVYQPVQARMNGKSLDLEHVKSLAGNSLAIKNPPHLLIIVHCDPKVAVKRTRVDKEDDSFFERLEFLEQLAKGYHDPTLKEFFVSLGSAVLELDTSEWQPKQTCEESVALVKSVLGVL
ncbi:thymidylate kinase [Candidatus Woesearchaeota archaeon]|nr:thymidylate kinase [Candidatus Woesearchaeota archaeon]